MHSNDYHYYNGEIYNNKILAVISFLSLFPSLHCLRVTGKDTACVKTVATCSILRTRTTCIAVTLNTSVK